jgi:hypothetical protein
MLVALIPIQVTAYAVFAGEDGKPIFRQLVATGVMELPGKDAAGKAKRVAAGFALGEHIEPADFKPNFVGFSETMNSAEWAEACKAKRAELVEKDKLLKQSKLVIPGRPGDAMHA